VERSICRKCRIEVDPQESEDGYHPECRPFSAWFTAKKTYHIDYREWEEYVMMHCPKLRGPADAAPGIYSYSLVADQELSNGSAYTFTVERNEEYPDDEETLEMIEEQWPHVGGWKTQTIVAGLRKRGLLKPGEYVINVSW
jgi:hypothetical protein